MSRRATFVSKQMARCYGVRGLAKVLEAMHLLEEAAEATGCEVVSVASLPGRFLAEVYAHPIALTSLVQRLAEQTKRAPAVVHELALSDNGLPLLSEIDSTGFDVRIEVVGAALGTA